MFRSTKESFYDTPSYFAWIGQQRGIYPETSGGQLEAVEESPAVNPIGSISETPTGRRRAPSRPRRGAAATSQPPLEPPSNKFLVSQLTDALPSASQASNRPNLVGENGETLLQDAYNRQRVSAATPAEAVAPKSMNLNKPTNQPHASSISTQHLPDAATVATTMARDQQLPSTSTYDAAEHQGQAAAVADAAVAGATGGGGGGGGSAKAPRSMKRSRSLFLSN